MPLVSIIIPLYNKEEYIANTISSVLNQSFIDYELIIIDDGSTDNSSEIVNNFSKLDFRVKYLFQNNQGVSGARNNGIKQAVGSYITFLDADDYWNENFLNLMINSIGENKVCYCGHNFVFQDDKKKAKIKFNSGRILDKYLLNLTTPHTNSWLINRKYLIDNNIFFNETINYGEDMLFFANVLLNTNKVTFVKEFLTNYSSEDTKSLSANNLKNIYKDIKWMELLITDINMSNLDKKLKMRSIEAIEGYRLPAAIVYRLLENIDEEDLSLTKKMYLETKRKIVNFKFNNGVRSLKLWYNLMKIKYVLR